MERWKCGSGRWRVAGGDDQNTRSRVISRNRCRHITHIERGSAGGKRYGSGRERGEWSENNEQMLRILCALPIMENSISKHVFGLSYSTLPAAPSAGSKLHHERATRKRWRSPPIIKCHCSRMPYSLVKTRDRYEFGRFGPVNTAGCSDIC